MLYCYSLDFQNYHGSFPDRDAALEAAREAHVEEDCEGQIVTTAVMEPRPMSHYVSADTVIDSVLDTASWDVGHEAVEGWDPVVSEDAKADFKALIDSWAGVHGIQPNFWGVIDVKEHRV